MLDLVGNPNCWFSHAQAHIIIVNGCYDYFTVTYSKIAESVYYVWVIHVAIWLCEASRIPAVILSSNHTSVCRKVGIVVVPESQAPVHACESVVCHRYSTGIGSLHQVRDTLLHTLS